MKFKNILALALFSLACSAISAKAQQQLFNGKDLTGWDGQPGWWTVEDGAITSESTPEKRCTKATYLFWTGGEPSDFELTLDFKISPNTPKANSGVQIRSERRPDWDAFGYQADMDGIGNLVGFVYHNGRGLIAARGDSVSIAPNGESKKDPIGDSEALKASFKPGEWNSYKIRCNGPEITLHVNGTLMCRFVDEDSTKAHASGFIALQMHPGPPMKVQFKNIVLTPIENQAPAASTPLQVIQSSDDPHSKAEACRELSLSGTSADVPALATLLADPEFSHLARFALARISTPEADKALREGLGGLTGEPLAGLIDTLGNRGDVEAVPLLLPFLNDNDSAVREAAATALGRIATPEATTGLHAALAKSSPSNAPALANGLIFSIQNDTPQGITLLDGLRTNSALPSSLRLAALRKSIMLQGMKGIPTLLGALTHGDDATAAMACTTALELKGEGIAAQLAAPLDTLPANKQILLISTLQDLGDPAANPELLKLAKSGSPEVRVAATRSIARIGGPDSIPLLLDLLTVNETAETASEGLSGAGEENANAAIIDAFTKPNAASLDHFCRIAAHRRMKEAIPLIQPLLAHQSSSTAEAAIKALGAMGGVGEFDALLKLLSTNPALERPVSLSLVELYRNASDTAPYATAVASSISNAKPETIGVLLKVLRGAGDSAALKVVGSAAQDSRPDIRKLSVDTLKNWNSPASGSLLYELAKASTSIVEKDNLLRASLKKASTLDPQPAWTNEVKALLAVQQQSGP